MQNNDEKIREEFVVEITRIKGGLMRTYKNADDWTVNYLEDSIKSLKELDKLPDKILSKIHQAEAKRTEEITQHIADYFAGLIVIPFPEATKEKLIAFIQERYK